MTNLIGPNRVVFPYPGDEVGYPHPLAVLTSAAIHAVRAAGLGPDAQIIWDVDRQLYRRTEGREVRLALYIPGLALEPDDFDPRFGTMEIDGSGEPVGHSWMGTPAERLMSALGEMPSDQNFLVGSWRDHKGQVTMFPGGAEPFDSDCYGGDWTDAASDAIPVHFVRRVDTAGTMIVLLGTSEQTRRRLLQEHAAADEDLRAKQSGLAVQQRLPETDARRLREQQSRVQDAARRLDQVQRELRATEQLGDDPWAAYQLLEQVQNTLDRTLFTTADVQVLVHTRPLTNPGSSRVTLPPPPGEEHDINEYLEAMSEVYGRRHYLDGSAADNKGHSPAIDDEKDGVDVTWWELPFPAATIGAPQLIRLANPHVIDDALTGGEETWQLMRAFGIESGFDRIVLAISGPRRPTFDQAAPVFAKRLPKPLQARNQELLKRVRAVEPTSFNARFQELAGIWQMLSHVEGKAEPEDLYLRAYTGEPPAASDTPTDTPRVTWISVESGTRPPDYLKDMAARYHQDDNLLEINADFALFAALHTHWTNIYARAKDIILPSFNPDTEETIFNDDYLELDGIVTSTVREWCEQQLVEVVVGVLALAGTPGWDHRTVQKALSPEALSATALPIYHVQQSVKRSLGQRLGSLKKEQLM
jgi:hypothetical protein